MLMRKYYVRKMDKDLIMLLQEDEKHDIYKYLLDDNYIKDYQWYFSQYETDRYMWAEDSDVEVTREELEKIILKFNNPISILDMPLDKEKNNSGKEPIYEPNIYG